MATIDLNGTALTYTDEGDGDPLVFVHGSASDYRTWEGQRPAFRQDYRVLTYSRRYHRPNAPIPKGADYAMQEHVDDLAALLRAWDATPAHLVGHSYGAFVALLLAMQRPDLVGSLALAEPPVITLFTSYPPQPGELLGLVFRDPGTAFAIAKFGITGMNPAVALARQGDAEAAMLTFGKAVLGEKAFRELSPERLAHVRENSIRAEFLGSGFPSVDPEAVRSITAPVLLITGDESPAFFHRVVDRLAELLPEAHRAEIPGASHISHEDNTRAYNRALRRFLLRCPPLRNPVP